MSSWTTNLTEPYCSYNRHTLYTWDTSALHTLKYEGGHYHPLAVSAEAQSHLSTKQNFTTSNCINPSSCNNKTNEMHYFLKFMFGMELYMFWTGFLSIIRSLVLYTQQQLYVIQVLPSMTYTYCCVLDSWWWTGNLSETCRVLFQT